MAPSIDLDVDVELALARLERLAAGPLRPGADGQRGRLDVRIGDATWAATRVVLADEALAARLARPAPWLAAVVMAVVDAVVDGGRTAIPTWDALRDLARRRDDVALRLARRPLLAVLHPLLGVPPRAAASALAELPAMPAGWRTPDVLPPLSAERLRDLAAQAWPALAPRLVGWRFVAGPTPWTAVRTPGTEVVSAVELGGTTVRAWSLAMHELGHALVGLAHGPVPRTLDEAAALTTQRWHPPGWPPELCAIAVEAFATQVALARWLAAVEVALYAAAPFTPPSAPVATALSVDPGAQAAYVAAADQPLMVGEFDGAALLAAVRARGA